ncbi:MAG: alpha/beta fold hydrolase [Bacteroidota bacterium]
MRLSYRITLAVLALMTMYTNQVHAQLPDLIDREVFFGDPEITGAQLSPDGKYISFIKPHLETRNVWVKERSAPFEDAKPVTANTDRPIAGYFWSQDGQYILFVKDQGGDENYNIYAVDPQGKVPSGETVPEARNLTDREGVRALIFAVPEKDPDLMYVGINDRDPAWHDLYSLKISTGELTLVRENTNRFTGWIFDNNDELRLATRSADNGDTEVLRVDDDGFTKIYSCDVLETCAPIRFHKDNERFYMQSNKGADQDLIALFLMDPQTENVEMVESDPKKRVDFGNAFFSDVTDELVGTSYTGDRRRRYWRNKDFERAYNFLQREFKGKTIGFGSSTKDENFWLISAYSDTDPGATYLFDRKNMKVDFQYRGRPNMPIDDLAPMQSVTYKSSDGMEIPAYLTLPKGVEAKNLPTVIFPHGGPWARDYWGYNSYHQFLANRGYAVLSPNFRGSTGYGKAFLDAGNGEWGQLMQDDLTEGANYLIKEGIADPDRIGIMGGSYGGYATLAGVTFTPDVYAMGISIVGPSSLETLLNSIPAYWEPIKKLFYIRMADPNTEEGQAQMKRQSPLFHADKIKTPLMVVQGANDPRVKQAESDQIVVAMRELGLPVEYLVAVDEGHGFAKPVNNMAFLAAAEEFMAEHLGGRYQKERNEEIAAKLEELRVDINTVTLPEALSEDALGSGIPEVAEDLSAAEYNYAGSISMGPQNIPMETTVTITEEGDTWVINESTSMAMGSFTDKVMVKKGSLEMVGREVEQGPVNINLELSAEKASGTLLMNGNANPIDQPLDGPLFADGGGYYQIIAQLPLEKGYTAYMRNMDMQSMQIKASKLEVTGTEEVTVPAGTFNTYKVEITSAEGEPGSRTIYVSTDDSRKAVKIEAVIPQMNGAKMLMELQ